VIVLTVVLLNARHLLMAAAMRPFVTTASLARRLGFAYILTDEAFALGIGWFRRGHRDLTYYTVFGAVLCAPGIWDVSRGNVRCGPPDPQRFGIDFAITAVSSRSLSSAYGTAPMRSSPSPRSSSRPVCGSPARQLSPSSSPERSRHSSRSRCETSANDVLAVVVASGIVTISRARCRSP